MAQGQIKNDAITRQEDDFAQWYTDVCRKAELMDYSVMLFGKKYKTI